MVSAATRLVDLQAAADERGIDLCAVGVAGVRLPIRVLDPDRGERETVATIRVGVDVPAAARGTHLSRFIEVLNAHPGRLTLADLGGILADLRARQGARRAEIEVEFDYFLRKEAPVSRAAGLMDYRCAFLGRDDGDEVGLTLRVDVPVATLCPCSKAISEAGAHNQRAVVRVELAAAEIVWIEEVVAWVEASASCPLYPVLKRVDEKHVTEHAYANPRFVEDVVREVIVRMREDARVSSVRVEAHSHESIHNHNAFAEARWTRASGARSA
jgi:GTP cyclohydrolase I